MFDGLFEEDLAGKLNIVNKAHAENFVTILLLLLEKGVFTQSEYNEMRDKAISEVEQVFAQKQEEVNKEFDKKHPGIRTFLEKILGNGS